MSIATKLPKGHRSLLDPAFRYTNSGATDVARTFARVRREMRQAEQEAKVKVCPIRAKLMERK